MASASSGAGDKAELSGFLRSRRARVTPQQVGLTAGAGRRVPGLRREEVALLAGLSADYYTRLERGRPINASDTVLDAVARALRLDDAERTHLFDLARRPTARTSDSPAPPQRVRPGLHRLVDSLRDTPAMIIGCRMDVLAANPLTRALYTDFDAMPRRERNVARYVFLDPAARELFTDWAAAGRDAVASLHLYAGRHPQDALLTELIAELSDQDDNFRRWWGDHEVVEHAYGTKNYRHPRVGEITLDFEALPVPGDPDQTLILQTAEPGSPSARALRSLSDRSVADDSAECCAG
ncbi:helix-turn-helix transcriptional regulator [Streptomyces sp. NBC_01619]|uniref:Helix-turn-helix transcriptional regulator n=1 Tax=Streptomyces pratisoli TaxID=3139917 RepID=A0ACC6QUV8_9ACTN|nr:MULTISPECIES: helix-turn-helix transcriptional regulator [unclassified Streptomyces]MCX4515603.1 helix-turn-helix transcriptional regulator [Streptomyces sp. NBC_01619]